MVRFPTNGTTGRGYLAGPESGVAPGVIVIQEWWGLVDHIKDIVDRFAAAGFVALAPDLYDGQTTDSPDQAGRLMMALEIESAERQLRGTIDYLLSRDDVTGAAAGTVGFCMGGQLSLYAACANPKVGACVDFYGIHPNVKPDLGRLQAPVLGFFAENDPSVTPALARRLERDLTAAGKQVELTVFEGADHGFFNDTRHSVYHAGVCRTVLGADGSLLQRASARGGGVAGRVVWAFLRGLRSWQLFVLAVSLFVTDLVIPDPVPLLDEILLGVVTLILARWKRPPT